MAISFDLLAATASFGGNPGIPRMLASPGTSSKTISPKARAQKPLQFGHESPLNGDIHLMLPEDHNLEGCEDHHPGLRAGYLISPDKFFSAPSSSSADSPSQFTPPQARSAPEVSVLLLRRGGCTFLRKLAAAKAAGFAGAIVWNSQNEGNESEYASSSTGGLINPSIDVEERAYADRELMDVCIVVVTREDGRSLERLVRWAETRSSTDEEEGRRRRDVVVEVFREPPPILFDHDVEVIDMDADLDMEIGVVVEEGHAEAADQAPKVPPTPKAGGAVEGLRALQDLLQEQQQKQQSPPTLSHSAHRILYINGLALRNTRLI
ncbi:hypothetical protein DL93DRAFT_448791 [Clavulina sp. PMI_390]|nr:hypothetical protein DL93DRAFT_448791 [Clavulina sp. PMI_390]